MPSRERLPDDSVQFRQFMASAQGCAILPEAAKLELVREFQAGHRPSQETLARHDAKFISTMVFRYRAWARERGIPLDDVFSAAHEGYCRSVEKFDFAKGVKLITYASRWMRGLIMNLARKGRTRQHREFDSRHSSLDDEKLVHENTDFNGPLTATTLVETLTGREPTPFSNALGTEAMRALHAAMADLTERERTVISGTLQGLTNLEVCQAVQEAEGLKKTPCYETIRQSKVLAQRKLRVALRHLRDDAA